MKIAFRKGESEYEADMAKGVDISIPMRFDGPQPNAYGVERASAKTCEYGDLVGDTRRGGSCNFEQYSLIPHCNGTHTECVGHITDERIAIRDCLKEAFFPALLISVTPTKLRGSRESYPHEANDDDVVVTSRAVRDAINLIQAKTGGFDALIVRSLPNSESKLSAQYDKDVPPYFTSEAISLINGLEIGHLICDLPSIDRLHDGGNLANHSIFWNVPAGSNEAGPGARRERTITELAFLPDAVADGLYLLNLQIAPFQADAAPSRPILFPAIRN